MWMCLQFTIKNKDKNSATYWISDIPHNILVGQLDKTLYIEERRLLDLFNLRLNEQVNFSLQRTM